MRTSKKPEHRQQPQFHWGFHNAIMGIGAELPTAAAPDPA